MVNKKKSFDKRLDSYVRKSSTLKKFFIAKVVGIFLYFGIKGLFSLIAIIWSAIIYPLVVNITYFKFIFLGQVVFWILLNIIKILEGDIHDFEDIVVMELFCIFIAFLFGGLLFGFLSLMLMPLDNFGSSACSFNEVIHVCLENNK